MSVTKYGEGKDAFYHFRDVLIVDRREGILGTKDDYQIEDNDMREIEISLNIPVAFFDPLEVKIECPPELAPPVVDGEVNAVEFPVEIEKDQNYEVVMSAKPGSRGTSFIAMIRRELKRMLGGSE